MRLDFMMRRYKLIRTARRKNVDLFVSPNARIFSGVRFFVGKSCQKIALQDGVLIRRNVDLEVGGVLEIGEKTVIGVGSFIQADGLVDIGESVLFGPAVKVFSTSHEYGRDGEIHKPLIKGEVRIADNVWIGSGAVIAMNVSIGENAVVGANAFVNEDVPANTVVGGVPAKIIKQF